MSDPGGAHFEKPTAGVRFDKPGGPVRPAAFARPASPIDQGSGPTYELASWGRRAGAALIDGFLVVAMTAALVGLVVVPILATDAFDLEFHDGDGEAAFVSFLLVLFLGSMIFLLVSLMYAPAWMWRTNGRTLGKQMLGIRVVRADGTRMTFAFAVFREFLVKGLLASVASSLTFYVYALVDALWPLWDSERRAIHDHIAKTRVVRD
ncbi:MAG: RDD family protein [Patulibacter sp.]|nr:RDD family protein [Patulibacter sp.]